MRELERVHPLKLLEMNVCYERGVELELFTGDGKRISDFLVGWGGGLFATMP